jgi:hypothetical protein
MDYIGSHANQPRHQRKRTVRHPYRIQNRYPSALVPLAATLHIQFELEGKRYPLSAMAELTDRVWFVLDSAYLMVDGSPLPAGSEHDVGVTLNLYPPYIRGLKRVARESKHLRAL